MSHETRIRWVEEETVNEEMCQIVEYGYYTSEYPHEPVENGWIKIEYQVNKFGKTIPLKDWK